VNELNPVWPFSNGAATLNFLILLMIAIYCLWVLSSANDPTIKYSALFEFKDSINFLKSLLKRIGKSPLPDRKKYGNSFLRTQVVSRKHICSVGFFEAFKDADGLLHSSYSSRISQEPDSTPPVPASAKYAPRAAPVTDRQTTRPAP
jgi:hypothetical protein